MPATGLKDRQFVNALARGLDILRAFKPGDVALGNQELAERTGLPKPTVSRLTSTLRELNYLVDEPRSGAYALGSAVLSLGYTVLANMDLPERAAPHLSSLAQSTGGTATLSAQDGDHVAVLAVRQGDAPVTVSYRLGMRLPIGKTACGLAILAGASKELRDWSLAALDGRMSPQELEALCASVKSARQEYEENGFCSVMGDWSPDVNMVAAPVYCSLTSRVVGLAVSTLARGAEHDAAWRQSAGAAVAEAARELTAPMVKVGSPPHEASA